MGCDVGSGCDLALRENNMEAIRKYFDVNEQSNNYTIACPHCKAKWELKKRDDGQVHVGNILSLLNHARSHD